MNKNHLAIILFSLTATSFVAQAENTPAPATETAPTATVPAEGSADAGSNPCTSIEDACKAAGFMAGGHKSGKGLLKNCMKPIL
ncbi:MAG: hypothetical protein PSV35_06765, partial [bacterium]|nr:hypothetical protein [bacterium]